MDILHGKKSHTHKIAFKLTCTSPPNTHIVLHQWWLIWVQLLGVAHSVRGNCSNKLLLAFNKLDCNEQRDREEARHEWSTTVRVQSCRRCFLWLASSIYWRSKHWYTPWSINLFWPTTSEPLLLADQAQITRRTLAVFRYTNCSFLGNVYQITLV